MADSRRRRSDRRAGLLFIAQTRAAGWIACSVVITVGSNLAGYSSHTYRSELFPTSVRARGTGLVYCIDRLTAAIGNGHYRVDFDQRLRADGALGFVTRLGLRDLIGSAVKNGPLTERTFRVDLAVGAIYKF